MAAPLLALVLACDGQRQRSICVPAFLSGRRQSAGSGQFHRWAVPGLCGNGSGLMDLISRILAPGLFGAQMVDADQPVFLAAQEEALVVKAAAKRRREFALGRSCAHSALSMLGHADAVIGRHENGAPHW